MNKSDRVERVISLIHLYFGRKLWGLRVERPLEAHERLLKTPEHRRRLEVQSAFQKYIEDVGEVIRLAAREYRETAAGLSDDVGESAVSFIENKLQILVLDTERHVRVWLFAACGGSSTRRTMKAIESGRNRYELAAEWSGPDWLLAERLEKIRTQSPELSERMAALLATDQIQEEMEDNVALRLGTGILGDEMLLIKARFLAVLRPETFHAETADDDAEDEDLENLTDADEPERQQRIRNPKPPRRRERLLIDIIRHLREKNRGHPATRLICQEIDKKRIEEPNTASALAPSPKWFSRSPADENPVRENQRTWKLAYIQNRTAVTNAVTRAWLKRSMLGD